MTISRRQFTALGAALGASSLIAPSAVFAQSYPTRPISLILPFPPGGGSDVVARTLGAALGKELGQSIVVDNRPGANGIIGINAAAVAAPDGYTLLMGTTSGLAIGPHVYKQRLFDPFDSFVPVGMAATSPICLITSGSSPHKTLGDLVAYGKANPNKLNYGHGGLASIQNLTIQQALDDAGFTAVPIAYPGAAAFMLALQRGDVDFVADTPGLAIPLLEGNKARVLGVASKARISDLPNVPTLLEQGVNSESQVWFAVYAPKGTPAAAVSTLEAALTKAVADPDFVTAMRRIAYTPKATGSAELGRILKAEYDKWGGVIQKHQIKLD